MGFRYLLIFIVVFVSFLLIGCKEHAHDERLDQIAVSISHDPEAAIVALDSIDRSALSKSDRPYYDFLTIKANDKAYVRHTSDSLYLSILDYYNGHKKDPLYPEVLYYGGRVYSDLGDYPTALNYYQNAIDILQEKENKELLRNAYSQTGVLLERLRLYNQAIPYFENSLCLTQELQDSIHLPYAYDLLGGVYTELKEFEKAKILMDKALIYSQNLSETDRAFLRGYYGVVYYELGELDSALNKMRDISDKVLPRDRNFFDLYTARIYFKLGYMDSAYLSTIKVLDSQNSSYRMSAYRMLLYPELRKYVPEDSINSYISSFVRAGEKYYNSYDVESINIQNAFYNYSLQERDREKVEKEKAVVWDWLLGSISLILLLLVVILYYKYNNKKQQIALHNALESLSQLKLNLNIHPVEDKSLTTNLREPGKNKEPDLRERLKKELLSLYERNKHTTLSDVIADSSAYRQIQESLEKGIAIPDDAPLWHEIERSVQEVYPDFKANLRLLTQSRLTSLDLHTALLIKCHFTPTQMSVLLGRSKGTIVSRRETLSLKIFDEKIGTKVIDGIIRLL